MDYSFYGGRRGAAFVITGRFRYISADKITQRDMKLIKEEYGDNKPIKTFSAWKLIYCMKEAFSQGGNYTVVNYDEYVIIDSFNKNDPDNGKLFRRGYSYTDELGGAQYVGQIVGPSGLGLTKTGIAIDTGSTEGNGTQKLVITYNDGTSTKVGNPINYIMRTAISADYHLLVLYSDPARRADIKARGQNNVWDGRDDWFDLGSIKEDSGLLVGMHYDTTEYADMGSIDSAIEHLNTEWPSGLIGNHLDGKVVTSGAKNENKYFFGFDYTYGDITTDGYKGWYYLGMFSGTKHSLNVVAGREDDAATQAIATTLPTGGIWMVTYAD